MRKVVFRNDLCRRIRVRMGKRAEIVPEEQTIYFFEKNSKKYLHYPESGAIMSFVSERDKH